MRYGWFKFLKILFSTRSIVSIFFRDPKKKNLPFHFILFKKRTLKFLKIVLNQFFNFFFPAVKFGRMSKKQREKVEDEVRFHRAQMRAQSDAAPDSSVFDTPTPSSSDQLHHVYNG